VQASAEAHLASCARCQAIAGTIARTESIVDWATPERRSPWRWLTWAIPLTAAATIVMMVVVEMTRETPQQQARADAPQVAAPPAEPAAAPPARSRDAKDEAAATSPPDLEKRSGLRADEKRANEARTGNAIDAIQPARPAAPPAAAQVEVGKQQKPAGATARAEESSRQLAQRFDSRVLEIRSANPATRWRVTGTQVERSTDAGSTWTPVFTGVTAGILAGAAPSDSICWLAGRDGIVLLSIDGTTWQRVTSPDTTDLSAIRATDGRTATVTTADGREFTTTDAGRTWVRRDLQENHPTPF
jgi:hypothetical protein